MASPSPSPPVVETPTTKPGIPIPSPTGGDISSINLTIQTPSVKPVASAAKPEIIAPGVICSVIAVLLIFVCFRRRQRRRREDDDLEKNKDISYFDGVSEKSVRTKAKGHFRSWSWGRKEKKGGEKEREMESTPVQGLPYEETGKMTPQSTAETLVNAPESIRARRLTANVSEWIYGVKGRASMLKSKIGSMRSPQNVPVERETESAASNNTITVGDVEGFQFGFNNSDAPATPMTSAPAPSDSEAAPRKSLSGLVSRVQSLRRTVSQRTRTLIPSKPTPELPTTTTTPQPKAGEPFYTFSGFPLASPTDTFDYQYADALAFEHYFAGRSSWGSHFPGAIPEHGATSNNRVSLWGGSSVGSISIQDSEMGSPTGTGTAYGGSRFGTESGWGDERSSYYAENVAWEEPRRFTKCASFNALEYLRQVENGEM